jgi:truncated hemoglobin YjbI
MIPDDNNAKEIITIFYRRAKARQIFRSYFVPRADTQKKKACSKIPSFVQYYIQLWLS